MRYLPVVLLLSLPGCASRAAPAPWRSPAPSSWPALKERLEQERRALPTAPWAAGLRATMRDTRRDHAVDGRGAIAVAPGRAVRMVLVGPAGTTMLDAWITRDRWRVAVPSLEVVRRGGEDAPPDLPVGFLRWWFLTPLDGALFGAAFTDPGVAWLLRDGDAVIELRLAPAPDGESLTVARRVGGRSERIEELRAGTAPHVGDRVHYVDETSGLRVDLMLESVASRPPDEGAFLDPDIEGGGS